MAEESSITIPQSLNTLAINVRYVDRVEANVYSQMHLISQLIWPCPSTKIPTPGVMKFTISVNLSLVIITIYLVRLIYAWK